MVSASVLFVMALVNCGGTKTQAPGNEQIAKTAVDPVCGMTVNKDVAVSKGLTADYQGSTYYFCNPGDRDSFTKEPQKFTKVSQKSISNQPAVAMDSTKAVTTKSQEQSYVDPVCGMTVDASAAKLDNLVATYNGKNYYFCSASDKDNFLKDPQKYIK